MCIQTQTEHTVWTGSTFPKLVLNEYTRQHGQGLMFYSNVNLQLICTKTLFGCCFFFSYKCVLPNDLSVHQAREDHESITQLDVNVNK